MEGMKIRERRRSRRFPIPAVSVEIRSAELPEQAGWTSSAIDINGDGMALVLPRELPPGTPLLLSFQADAQANFDAVPCLVRRQDRGYGAVTFDGWSQPDILSLLGLLADRLDFPTPAA